MSRTKAKKMFKVDDQIRATEGIGCRKDADVIDEIPMAYKNIDTVMRVRSEGRRCSCSDWRDRVGLCA